MKRILTIITAALVSTALFSNCKKDNDMAQPGNTNGYKSSASAISNSTMTQVSYTMNIIQPATADLMEWNSGHMMVGGLFFSAGMEIGNAMKKAHYTASVNRYVSLLPATAPENTTQLGNVNMVFGKYFGPVFGIVLAGVNPQMPGEALVLNGKYMNGGKNIDVQVVVSQPIEIMANLFTPVLYLYNEPVNVQYTAVLSFNLKQFAGSINSSMLDNAVVTNNTILISDQSNQNLYQLIRNNLAHSLSVELKTDASKPVLMRPDAAPGPTS